MPREETGARYLDHALHDLECETLLSILFDGMVDYFRHTGVPAPIMGDIGHEPDGGCSVSVVFPSLAHLTYTLMVRMREGETVARVETDTIGVQVNVLKSAGGMTVGDLITEAAELYRAIGMDVQRVLFTND